MSGSSANNATDATDPKNAHYRNPFDVLPANLFNLLGTHGVISLQRHYLAILLRLYSLTEISHYPLQRETVIVEIAQYLTNEHAEQDVAAQMEAEGAEGMGGEAVDSEAAEVSAKSAEDLHNYAAYLLRRLVDCGWVEREQHTDYSETITFPDYAFTLLEALRTIQEQKPREFKGQLYTAHQLITSSNKKDFSAALAITQAYENVRQVARGLSELNQNIRRYIERATRGRTVPDLLRMQFDDYSQTLGPAYHALKTSDHVSRYRRAIVDQLQRWQHSTEWLEQTAAELATQRRISPAQALEEIASDIVFIIQQLEALDPMIESIDQRHAQYLKTSLRQVRYQLVGASSNFKDRLVSLGRMLSESTTNPDPQAEADVEAQVSSALYTHPIRLPDANSFYTPPQKRKPFTPIMVESPVLELSDLAALRHATLVEVTQALTPGKVNALILRLMNGSPSIHLRDLPVSLREDLHTLTSVVAFSYHPGVHYGIEPTEGEPVTAGEFVIQPFQLTRGE